MSNNELNIDQISDNELDKIVGGAAKVEFNIEQVLNIRSQRGGI